ncbi:Eukaryotic translation initiation factor 3 subunit E, partial [Operophtera brumata]
MSYSKFDLTFKIGQYLDRHLVFPLLEFLAAKDTYDQSELLQAKLDILSKTNMIDYVIDIRRMLYPDEDTPEEIKSRRGVVLNQLQELQDAVEPVLRLMQRDDVMKTVETMRDPKTLINHLTTNKEFENYLPVLWGKLASEILVQNWDGALEDLTKLREFIDNGGGGATATNMQALQQRTWLIHWSLFIFFNHVKGRDLIIEMYLNAIQTMCPHILRYLATAVIINRSRRNALKDLVKVIQQEAYTYRYCTHTALPGHRRHHQPVAQERTQGPSQGYTAGGLHIQVLYTYCAIWPPPSSSTGRAGTHSRTSSRLYSRRPTHTCTIDSKLGHVVMGAQPLSPYQQLVERIDSLAVRSEALSSLVERKQKTRVSD